jgi:hypothetical protein
MRNVNSTRLITALASDVEQRLTRTRTRLHRAGHPQRLRQAAIAIMRDVCRSLRPFRDAYCPTNEQGRHGYPGYRPPAALRRMLLERHTTCVFPTCNRRAEHCDVDHTIAYNDHGPTCGCNLAVLCRRHHRCKQRSDWHLFQPWPGLLIWITPAGTWHIVQPD